jgi:hypothetical protein
VEFLVVDHCRQFTPQEMQSNMHKCIEKLESTFETDDQVVIRLTKL